MKHITLPALLGTLALGLASSANAGVSLNIGFDPFGYGAYAAPPVVYQPAPYYAPPPVVYFGGGYWGGNVRRRGDDRRGVRPGGARHR